MKNRTLKMKQKDIYCEKSYTKVLEFGGKSHVQISRSLFCAFCNGPVHFNSSLLNWIQNSKLSCFDMV